MLPDLVCAELKEQEVGVGLGSLAVAWVLVLFALHWYVSLTAHLRLMSSSSESASLAPTWLPSYVSSYSSS